MKPFALLLLLAQLLAVPAVAATTTSNMGLLVPQSGDTDYPTSILTSFTAIDAHDHTSGKGVTVPANGLASNAVTTTKILDGAVTIAKLDATAITTLQTTPPGAIIAYGGTTAPDGYLLCDGAAVSRTTYAALYAVVSTNFGNGNGTTTFNTPDLRGRFVRGRAAGQTGIYNEPEAASRVGIRVAGVDVNGNTGDNVGSMQLDSTALPNTSFTTGTESATHTHTFSVFSSNINDIGGGAKNVAGFGSSNTTSTESATHIHTVTGGGDTETRPVNVAVTYIIKY